MTWWSPCLLCMLRSSRAPAFGLPVAMECGNGSTRHMMPVGTSKAHASAGATRTTPPVYIISCL